MTLRGRVENGVIKLLEGPIPAEGTEVEVNVRAKRASHRPGTMDAILALNLRWQGEIAELERLEKQVQEERELDLKRFGG